MWARAHGAARRINYARYGGDRSRIRVARASCGRRWDLRLFAEDRFIATTSGKYARNVGYALLALATSACVPIPPTEEKPFEDASEEWFTTGTSTLDDVVDRIGEPTLDGAGWWLYREPYEGWLWLFCMGGAYGGFGCGGLPRETTGHFLVVEHDPDRVVTNVATYTEGKLCKDRQICYSGEFLMRPAAPEDGSEAANAVDSSAGCTVYTYSETDSDLAAGELYINGVNAGGLVSRSGYYRHRMPQGTHEWRVAPSQSKTLPLPAATHNLECQGDETFYLRYTYGAGTFWFNKIRVVEPARGERDIAKRWLAVSSAQ